MNIAFVFILLAAVFIALSIGDYVKKGSGMTPARKTWLIIALVFGVVAVVNLFMN